MEDDGMEDHDNASFEKSAKTTKSSKKRSHDNADNNNHYDSLESHGNDADQWAVYDDDNNESMVASASWTSSWTSTWTPSSKSVKRGKRSNLRYWRDTYDDDNFDGSDTSMSWTSSWTSSSKSSKTTKKSKSSKSKRCKSCKNSKSAKDRLAKTLPTFTPSLIPSLNFDNICIPLVIPNNTLTLRNFDATIPVAMLD